ncbi:probable tRNA N6-adenosine threonylcarbamoyltransferase, mitochondrial [Trichoplusia ni]|uniref:N(6)-L-threonylcarbamoyladenine synthase n=1 Tax=Trichoplusia ni TaxID=7111 RepID=A0A7E5WGU9_TRINI|nr:probable tRNA N6-adenosine threonylcarbamoyltransferase, mitochondrial [Trichoplusia ni]
MLFHKYLRRTTIYAVQAYSCRALTYSKNTIILGIETSCDDTGCAVIDGKNSLLGESLYSQNAIHIRFGGVNPLVAHELHRENIEKAVAEALNKANKTSNEVDAIAVTTKPGLLVSLQVGVKYARYLSKKYSKPIVPIHHMEAHALVARMYYDLPFPYIVLLISGGHCLLALVKDINDFVLFGKSLDNAPGEVLDKVARRMKLKNISEYSKVSGGRAVEMAAQLSTNPGLFEFTLPLLRHRDCNFSFSGLKDALVRKLIKKEHEHNLKGDEIIPEVNDLCAGIQCAVAEHLAHRTQRALMYCEKNNLISPENRRLVVSGGVACNNFIFESIKFICNNMGYNTYRPPANVCTDNGVMIAWNGLEKVRKQCDIRSELSMQEVDPEAPLGINCINEVTAANIQTKATRLKRLYNNMGKVTT